MSKELIEELSQTIDTFLESTGSKHWINSEKLVSITAKFSDDIPCYQLGTIPFQTFVSDCKELQKKINQIKAKENVKEQALSLLREAMKLAPESGLLAGLFDELQGYCGNPDSINDVCDAVDSFKRYYYYHSWIADECFRENENDNGFRHTTYVTNHPPKEFLASLLNGWVEIRQFPSKEKMEEFAKTVGLGR